MFRKNIYKKFYLSILITFFFFGQLYAQKWDVTADKKAKKSFIKFDKNTAKEGETIYTKNCKTCHGNPGKGDFLITLKPHPVDLASSTTQKYTDGDLFYIISTGRQIMPSFKNVLSEDERWKVISFIRSFNKTYIQVLSLTDPNKSKLVNITMDFDSISNKVNVMIKANEKTGVVNLKDAEVLLFVNRYFGKMQIDKTIRTNNEGKVTFSFPKDLPGDKTGMVDLTIKVNDDNYGEIESQNKLKIGIPTDKPGLNEKRAIWNVVNKAPFWIIITFTSILLVVMFFLGYILYSLFKIRKIGAV